MHSIEPPSASAPETASCHAPGAAQHAGVFTVDRLFSSLGDPTRLAIVERLACGRALSVGDLAAPFATSLPAIIKHIDVLENAGVVVRRRQGRNVLCMLSTDAMAEAMAWLDRNLGFWNASFDRLEALVDGKENER